MKFTLLVSDRKTIWEEPYDENVDDAWEYAENIIKSFNATLRPHELPRELVDVIIHEEDNAKHHEWVKRTNGMSVSEGKAVVDLFYCKKCGLTAKRFGLRQAIIIDSKFKKTKKMREIAFNCGKAKEYFGGHS